MKTVLMHGPSLSDPSKIVEREIVEVDVQAYRAAGYVEGGLPKKAVEAKSEGKPAEGVEVKEAPTPVKRAKSKKK